MIRLCDTWNRGIHLGALDGLGVSFWDPEGALGSFGWPLGVLGGSLGGPRSIFNGFWVSLGRAWGTCFSKNRSLDVGFSLHVFGMVPGNIFWRFPVFLATPRTWKSVKFMQPSSEIKGHTNLVYAGFGMPPGSILGSSWRPVGSFWAPWAHLFWFVRVLGVGLNFNDFARVPWDTPGGTRDRKSTPGGWWFVHPGPYYQLTTLLESQRRR